MFLANFNLFEFSAAILEKGLFRSSDDRSHNRKNVPYHGANPNTINGGRLRSPFLIMAPGDDSFWRLQLCNLFASQN